MRIRRFNENIDVKHIDPKEVCPECGAIAMHLTDHSSFDIPDKFIEDGGNGMNFDDYFHGDSKCDNCGYKSTVEGYIEWNTPRDMEKREKYIEMYKNGMDPIQIKKYNL